MLPTLALGIPGSSGMAVLLGGFLIQGIQPGPTFLRDHLDLAWTITGTLVLANVLGMVICFLAAPTLIKVTRVRGHLLAPSLLSLMALGAYSYQNSLEDVFLTFGLAFFAWAMRQLGYPRPGVLCGLCARRTCRALLRHCGDGPRLEILSHAHIPDHSRRYDYKCVNRATYQIS